MKWILLDPLGARGAIGTVADPREQMTQLRAFFDVFERLMPRTLLSDIQLVPETLRRGAVAGAIVTLAWQDSPREAVDHLRRIALQGEKIDLAAEFLVGAWARMAPVDAITWILEETGDIDVSEEDLLAIALPHLAVADPEKAIQMLSNPIHRTQPESDGVTSARLQARVISSLASNGSFDAALDVMRLVEPSRKFEALRTVGLGLIEFDQPDRAIELARDLPESSRLAYFEALANYWSFLNVGQLIDKMPRFPSKSVRASIARIVWSDREYLSLTDEQIALVEAALELEDTQ